MNDFKVEYLENMKFVDWDNYEKSEMKDDCIKYIKDLQQRIDKLTEKINFYKTTEWGLKGYSILETFEEILKGNNND